MTMIAVPSYRARKLRSVLTRQASESAALAVRAWLTLRTRAAVARSDESGQEITNTVALIFFGVLIIAAIAVLINKLDSNIFTSVENTISNGLNDT
jgi:hypothetical protein